MSEHKEQRIRDPLHNIISFNCKKDFERMIWQLIQEPVFQRLRRIKQLGFSELVYPGATHSRFSHSIGTFHLARRLVQIIDLHHKPDEEKGCVALVAALVHDLGHGPFSHAFADVSKTLDLQIPEHEFLSAEIVRQYLGPIFEKALGATAGMTFRNKVADMLSQNLTGDIYRSVVSSQFDADRLDYMQRDRLMTGTQLGNVDLEWLMNNLETTIVVHAVDNAEVGEAPSLVLGHKALSAAESYVLNLFQLYPNVYFHKTTRGAEKLFTKWMTLVLECLRDDVRNCRKLNLSRSHPIVAFARKPKDIEHIVTLDDTVVWGMLSLLRGSSIKEIAFLAERLLNRNLPACIDIRSAVEERLLETQISSNEKSKDGVKDEDFPDRLDLICDTIEAELRTDPEKFENILIDKGERSPYKRYQEDKGSLNQIRIRPLRNSARTFDINHWSKTIATAETFKFFRVYVEKDDAENRELIRQLIEAAIGKEGSTGGPKS